MRRLTARALPILAALILAIPRPAAGEQTYISLGDSIAFGETDFTHDPSNGDRGYVAGYADYLRTVNGVRPKVVNLAIDGETTGSFTGGKGRVSPAPGLYTDAFLVDLNTHYAGATPTTQNSLFRSTVTTEQLAGNTIATVSISLGSNDLFALALSPAFNAPNADQAALLTQSLGTIQANVIGLLTEVRGLLPTANILLVGAYNPFPAVPNSPFAPIADPAIRGLDAVLAGVAPAFGAQYIDTYRAFQGHEAGFTHITDPPAGSNNVHPNAAGYAAITAGLVAVPEPGGLSLMGLGVCTLLGYGWSRRQGAAA